MSRATLLPLGQNAPQPIIGSLGHPHSASPGELQSLSCLKPLALQAPLLLLFREAVLASEPVFQQNGPSTSQLSAQSIASEQVTDCLYNLI